MRILGRILLAFVAAVLYVVLGGPHHAAKAQQGMWLKTTTATPSPTPTPNPIQHVVVIIQENRTWNNLFNGYPGSTSSTTYEPSAGGTPAPLATTFIGGEAADPSHAHAGPNGHNQGCGAGNGVGRTSMLSCGGFVTECDANYLGAPPFTCAMDGFDVNQAQSGTNAAARAVGLSYIGSPTIYLHQYWNTCNAYTCADETFQGNQGPSQPAHLYLVAGSSICLGTNIPPGSVNCIGGMAPTIGSEGYVAENSNPAGCENPGGGSRLIDTTSAAPGTETLVGGGNLDGASGKWGSGWPGCGEIKTIFDLIEASPLNLTWKWYTGGVPANKQDTAQAYWQVPHEVQHFCGCGGPGLPPCPQSPPTCTNTVEMSKVSTAVGAILSDISGGTLPSVSFVSPINTLSDHATDMALCNAAAYVANGNTCLSPAYVASILNAIGTSSYWANTTALVVWDDWGGIYDPVAPPAPSWNSSDPYAYGFRVPLQIVSPYIKTAGAVDHTVRNFDSILAYIETTFRLGNLNTANLALCASLSFTTCEPTLDVETDDLTACCFNFARSPLTYVSVDRSTPHDHAVAMGKIFAAWARGSGIADGGPITPEEYYRNGAPDTDYTADAPNPFQLPSMGAGAR